MAEAHHATTSEGDVPGLMDLLPIKRTYAP